MVRSSGAGATVDKRVTRSRKMIYDAFLELAQERGLDGFAVSDLADRAGINRSTFYSHFKDKDDLIAQIEDEFIKGATDIEEKIGEVDVEKLFDPNTILYLVSVFIEGFDYLRESAPFISMLMGKQGDIAFMHRLRDVLEQTLRNKILNPKYRESDDALVDYYVAFYASAFVGIVRAWFERGMVESSEEMAMYALQLAALRIGDPIEFKEFKVGD